MGFPTETGFYVMTAVSAAIWCINDIIYYRAIPVVGAGVVSRILPASVIIAFIVWFFFEPSLLTTYLENPQQAGALVAIVLLSVFFAIALKSCPITMRGFRLVWFVVIAAALGPLVDKLALGYAPAAKAPFAYMFTQGMFMLWFWLAYTAIKKPVTKTIFFSKEAVRGGLAIGVVACIKLGLKFEALIHCEHPALLSVILFTDALWIICYYRLTGREDHSKIWAGLGLVGCAAALVLVKSL